MTQTEISPEKHSPMFSLPENEALSGRRLSQDKPRYIVVGVDCREGSIKAFEWTVKHLAAPGDTVLLLYVFRQPASEGLELAVEQVMGKMAAEAQQKYMVHCEIVCKPGDAKEVLCSEVTRRDAVALVVGSRGLPPMKRALLGSVSDYCARTADCPVVVVRDKVLDKQVVA